MGTMTMTLYEIINNFYSRQEVESWFSNYELDNYLTEEEIATIVSRGTWSKQKLAKKIVDNYLMREIGFETMALFKHYAKIEMEKIMESKLPLIYSAAISYDPLVNVDFTETFGRSVKANGSSSASGNSHNNDNSSTSGTTSNNSSGLTIDSDTPQGQITKASILNGSYASNTSANESTDSGSSSSSFENISSSSNSTSGSSNSETNEDYIKHIKGNSGVSATAQKMIQLYRDNIIAIDKDIIEEIGSIFSGIY